ncbi:hypothetical protein GCM10018966_019830 [Streptomyces yanii]
MPPLDGGVDVEGDVRCAGLEDPQQGGNHLRGALHQDHDLVAASDPEASQPVRHLIGPLVDLAIGPALVPEEQGQGLGGLLGPPLEQLVNADVLCVRRVRVVPLMDQPGVLGRGEEGQLPEAGVRLAHQLGEDLPEVSRRAFDGPRREAPGVVVDGEREALPEGRHDAQRVGRVALLPDHPEGAGPGSCLLVLDHQDAVEERFARADPAPLLDQPQGAVLVLQDLRVLPLQALHPLRPACRGRNLDPQGKRVDERPDHVLDTRQVGGPAGGGDAHDHLVGAPVTAQEEGPGTPYDRGKRQVPPRSGGAQGGRLPFVQDQRHLFVHGGRCLRGGVLACKGPELEGKRADGRHRPQLVTPECLGPAGVLTSPPLHVLLERHHRRFFEGLPGGQRLVHLLHFAENPRLAPRVHQEVVEAPQNPAPRIRQVGDMESPQRGLVQ